MTDNTARWLSISEASVLLGVSKSTLRRWADNGLISAQITPGRHRRFERLQLEAWLRNDSMELEDFAAALRQLFHCLESDPERQQRQTIAAWSNTVQQLQRHLRSDTETHIAAMKTMLLQLQDRRSVINDTEPPSGQTYPETDQLNESSRLLLELYASSVRKPAHRN